MYLEISGRATGKTSRLIEAVAQYIFTNHNNVANIIAISEESAEHTKQMFEKQFKGDNSQQVRYTIPERKNAIVRGYSNVKNFYDEFDGMNLDFKKDGGFFYTTIEDDYYVTTPTKIRDLSKISIQQAAKNDFLLRMLLENKGMYYSFVHVNADPSWLKPILESYDKEDFDREILGKFIKY